MIRKTSYLRNVLIGADQFIGTLFGITADITISGWVGYKYPGSWLERGINWLFHDPEHCAKSIEWDVINRGEPHGNGI